MSLYDAVEAFLEAERAYREAVGAAPRHAAAAANLRWQGAVRDLSKAVCSEVGRRMWNPILGCDAEDVAQEVLSRFLNRGPKDDITHARGWILKAIGNGITDLLRRRHVRRDIENPLFEDEDDGDIPGLDDWEDKVLEQEQLQRWQEKLNKALDAASQAIERNTKLKDLGIKRWIFEETVLYERKEAKEIVSDAGPGSPYVVAGEGEASRKKAENLVQQHATRYRKELRKVVEGGMLCSEQQTVLSNILLYLESKSRRKQTVSSRKKPKEEWSGGEQGL